MFTTDVMEDETKKREGFLWSDVLSERTTNCEGK